MTHLSETSLDLDAISGQIEKLQRSAKRTLPVFFLGVGATIVAATIAIYFIVSLSSRLSEANAALKLTERRLAAAQQNLAIAQGALQSVSGRGGTGEESLQITAAISDVKRSQLDLKSASAAVRDAASKLPASAKAGTDTGALADAPAPIWFAVVGSYKPDAEGLGNARAQAKRARQSGLCAEIWKTQISNHYAVVIGTLNTRDAANASVQRAKQTGLASDAFSQANRGWSRLPDSPICG